MTTAQQNRGGIAPRIGRSIDEERSYMIECFTRAIDAAIQHNAWYFRADYTWLSVPPRPERDQ